MSRQQPQQLWSGSRRWWSRTMRDWQREMERGYPKSQLRRRSSKGFRRPAWSGAMEPYATSYDDLFRGKE